MDRRTELVVLIKSLIQDIHSIFDDLYFKSSINDYLKKHSKVQELQKQLDDYIKELDELNEQHYEKK